MLYLYQIVYTLNYFILKNNYLKKLFILYMCVIIKCFVHFREVKVRVLKSDPLAWVTGSLTRRKTSTESFLLTLIKVTT